MAAEPPQIPLSPVHFMVHFVDVAVVGAELEQ